MLNSTPVHVFKRIFGFMISSDGGLVKHVLRSGAWVGISNGGLNVLQIVRTAILARLLTPEVFGLMGLCQVVIRGIDTLTETGMSAALIHRQERVEEAKDTAFVLQVCRGILLAVCAFAVAPLAAAFYSDDRLGAIIGVLALVFVIGGFANINTVLLQKRLDFRRLTVLDLLVGGIGTVLIVALAYRLRNVWALVLGQIGTALARVVISYLVVPGRPRFRFNREMAADLFRYGRFITGLTVVLFITTELDNLAVGKLIGFEALGLYSLAFMVANLPVTHIAKIVSGVLFPAYSALQHDRDRIRVAYLTALRAVAGLTIPAATGIAILAPEIIGLGFGAKWLPAVATLRILTVFGGTRAIGLIAGYLYNALGKPSVSFYIVLGKLVAVLALIYPMTLRFGLEGAATAVAIPQVLADVYSLYVVRRMIGLRLSVIVRILGRIAARTAAMGAVVLGLRVLLTPVNLAELVALVAVGAAAYAALSLRDLRELYADTVGGRARRRPAATSATGPGS